MSDARPSEQRPSDLPTALVANAVLLALITSDTVWRPWTGGVVTEAWSRAVSVASLSALAQVLGNALLMVYRPALLQRVLRFAFSAASLAGAAVFNARYPFDFTRLGVGWLDPGLRVLLLVAVIGAGAAAVADLLRLLFPRPRAPHARFGHR